MGGPDVFLKGLFVSVNLAAMLARILPLHALLALELGTYPAILIPVLEVKVQLFLRVGAEVAEGALYPLDNL